MVRRLSALSALSAVSLLSVLVLGGAACRTNRGPAERAPIFALTGVDAGREAAVVTERVRAPRQVDRAQACMGDHMLREQEANILESRKLIAANPPATENPDDNGFSDYRVSSKDRCGVAENNVEATLSAILAGPMPRPEAPTRAAWNGTSPPTYLDRIDARFRLTREERGALSRNGFFASDRMVADSYGSAFHDVFQSELPVFISMDALFQAIFAAHDGLLADLEAERLSPALSELLARMSCALPDAAKDYPDETAHDLDTYLTVARMLIRQTDKTVLGDQDDDEAAHALASLAEEGTAMRGADGSEPVMLFGRPRVIDFTQYTPRGHYNMSARSLDTYFRAVMWLSRLELNVKTRDGQSSQPGASPDRSETPREARLALALSDLAARSDALPLIETMDRGFSLLAGTREDLSVANVLALRKKAGIEHVTDADAPARLNAAIGSDFKRTARLHFMPEGVKELPVIMTLLGPRVVPDATAMRPLVHDEIQNRVMVTPLDVAFMLGHDRAKAHMGKELTAFPALPAALDRARKIVDESVAGADLYSAWLAAARATSQPQGPGAFPSFTRTDAYKDLAVNTSIAAFGQIRHNYVLLAGQPYDAYGCEIPDGYVEPAPMVLDALIAYAARGEASMAQLDPAAMSGGADYFKKLSRVLRALRVIVARELAGQPLTGEQRRFLSLVAEYVPSDPQCTDSCAPPHYSGWWFDLHPKRKDGLSDPSFVIDYYTSVNAQAAAYIGAEKPVMGVFVVDQGGAPRAYVGPVARAFGQPGPISPRLTDSDATRLKTHDAPWRASYGVSGPAEPPLLVTAGRPSVKRGDTQESWDIELSSTRELGTVSVTILDHHRRPVSTQERKVGTKGTTIRFTVPRNRDVSGMFVRVDGHDFGWVPPKEKEIMNGLTFALGSMRADLEKKQAEAQGGEGY